MATATLIDPFAGSLEGTEQIWERLARPFDVTTTIDALLGLSPDVVEQLVGMMVSTCDEAEILLAGMPKTLRSLKTSIGTHLQRCVGELRGPVQWSESLAAQASSLGNKDVFVCATPNRAYDIDENQVLVAALRAIADAGYRSEKVSDDSYDDDGLRRARANARRARRYLDHRSLSQVQLEGRPSKRAVNRTRAGKSNAVYRPALAMLDRALEPLSMDELAPFCDRRTRAQHALVANCITELESRGLRVPSLRAESGSLFAGPVEFIHPRRRGDTSRLHGVLVGHVLIDVPQRMRDRDREKAQADLDARAHGRAAVAILDPGDIHTAVDQAILVARRG